MRGQLLRLPFELLILELQAIGETPLTGSFEIKFPGEGSFKVKFSVTDFGHTFEATPSEIGGMQCTASSSMVGQTLNGNVSIKPSA